MENNKLIIQSKRPKGEDGFKTFSVRIREDTVTKIEQIANQTNRSRNELIGILLEYAVERCVIESEQKEEKRTPAISSNFNKPQK